MRLINLILLLVTFLLLPGTALANPQEQFILHQINVGNFDIWQHTDGRWQDTDHDGPVDPYGLKNKEVTETYTYHESQYSRQFIPTRVEIEYFFTLTDEELTQAGRSESWSYFYDRYLRKTPKSYSVEKTGEDLTQGKVTVQKTFDMMPKSLNLKDPTVRAELGMDDQNFSNLAQGWRWYTPVLITWYGVPKAEMNLMASSIDPGIPSDEAEPGERYTATVKFKYFGNVPVDNVPIAAYNGEYRATLKKSGQPITTDNFAPGDIKTYTFDWTAPGSGETVLKGVIDTPPLENKYQETTEEDNIVQTTVLVRQPPPSPGSGSLTSQAVSQDGTITRPTGTAKWTDRVTATLRPERPTPPRGSLDWWRVTNASLTYPKKNYNFSFGTPYGPSGTRTISMNASGHTANATFEEDWAMDGARIYSMIERRMMAEHPKNYTITADYAITYQYSYYVWRGSGEDRHKVKRTRTGTNTGGASGQLLVNGTGVDSRAQ